MRLSAVTALSLATSALALMVPHRVRADLAAPGHGSTDVRLYRIDASGGKPTFMVTSRPLGEVGTCPVAIPLSERTTLEDKGRPTEPEVAFVGKLADGSFAVTYLYTDEVGERGT